MLCFKLLYPCRMMYSWKFFFLLGWSKDLYIQYYYMCIHYIIYYIKGTVSIHAHTPYEY